MVTDAEERHRQELDEAAALCALGFVAGGIAHELRNALTPLLMNLELAQMLLRSNDVAERAKAEALLEEALGGTAGLARLVEAVQVVGGVGEATELDVRELLEAVLRALAGELRRRGRLQLDAGTLPRLVAPKGLLGRLLLCVLVDGLARLAPERRAQNVLQVRLGAADGELSVEVTPHHGAEVEVAPAARAPSAPAVSSTEASKAQGHAPAAPAVSRGGAVPRTPPSCLGLNTARRLAAQLGATLELRGDAPEAQRLLLRLPASKAPAAAQRST